MSKDGVYPAGFVEKEEPFQQEFVFQGPDETSRQLRTAWTRLLTNTLHIRQRPSLRRSHTSVAVKCEDTSFSKKWTVVLLLSASADFLSGITTLKRCSVDFYLTIISSTKHLLNVSCCSWHLNADKLWIHLWKSHFEFWFKIHINNNRWSRT